MAGWKWIIASALLLVVIAAGGLWVLRNADSTGRRRAAEPTGSSNAASPSDERADQSLPRGVTQAQYERARNLFREIYPDHQPNRLDTFMTAGELAVAEEQPERAVVWFREIPTSHPRYGLSARLQEGAVLTELNRLEEAEASLRNYWEEAKRAEQVNVQHVRDAYKRLEYILSLEIRLEERAGLLIQVHRAGLADVRDSKHLFFPNLLILNSTKGREKVAAALKQDPDSLKLRIARARYHTLAGAFEPAVSMLQQLRKTHPENRRVVANLLEAFFESGQMQRFENVASELPEYAQSEPWLLTRMRGEYALSQNSPQQAVEHFQNVLAADPANAAAQMSLASAWGQLGNTEKQQEALRRSSILAEIRVNLNNVQNDALKALRELSDKCRDIDFEQAANMFDVHAKSLAQQREGAPASP